MIRKLRDMFLPGNTRIKEPAIKKKQLDDQPEETKTKTSWFYKSRSHKTYLFNHIKIWWVYLTWLNKEPTRHSSYTTSIPNLNGILDLNQEPQSCYIHPLLDKFPLMFHPYVSHIENVRVNGNCGFRAISVCIGYGKDQWFYVGE